MLRCDLISSGREQGCEPCKYDFDYRRSPLSVYQPTKEKMSVLENSIVQLDLSPEAFLVVYEYLYHTRLGDRNGFEVAVSDFLGKNPVLEELANDLSEIYGTPKLHVEYSDDEGLVLNVVE